MSVNRTSRPEVTALLRSQNSPDRTSGMSESDCPINDHERDSCSPRVEAYRPSGSAPEIRNAGMAAEPGFPRPSRQHCLHFMPWRLQRRHSQVCPELDFFGPRSHHSAISLFKFLRRLLRSIRDSMSCQRAEAPSRVNGKLHLAVLAASLLTPFRSWCRGRGIT